MKQHTITISFTDPLKDNYDDNELVDEITEVLENIGLEDIDISFPKVWAE